MYKYTEMQLTLNPNVVFWMTVVATTNTTSEEMMEMYSKL